MPQDGEPGEPADAEPTDPPLGWRWATDEEMAEHSDRIFQEDEEILDRLGEM